jgi:hypothetical protein
MEGWKQKRAGQGSRKVVLPDGWGWGGLVAVEWAGEVG